MNTLNPSVNSDFEPIEKRRLPRLSVAHELFRLDPAPGAERGKVFSVVDVSASGFALQLLDEADAARFPLGSEVRGTLNLNREKIPVRAQVRNHDSRGSRIGLEFQSLAESSRETIEALLHPARLGESLRPVPAEATGALVYEGLSGTRAAWWREWDGSYRRFWVSVLGCVVVWDTAEGLASGRLTEGGAIRETPEFTRDSAVDAGKLAVAKTVLLSSNLPKDLSAWCARQLTPQGRRTGYGS